MDDIRKNPMASEQDDFNRLAARAIHLMGLLGARLALDPDDIGGKNAALIETAFAVMAKRLPIVVAALKKAEEDLQLERHANANLKITIATLRDRVKLFRDFVAELHDNTPSDEVREMARDLLKVQDVP